MKLKFFLPALFVGLWILTPVFSQNFQMHYDMGEGRGYVTSTIEMFKPDKWGSTFYFADFDYDVGDVKGVSLGYLEISRALKFWESPIAFQVEYNGGLGQFAPGAAYQIHDAWLSGVQYTWNNSDYSRVFTLQALYKYIRDVHDVSFQVTGVWSMHFSERKYTFMGFADFWKQENPDFGTDFVFLAEPQIWYNATDHLSLGGEIEVASNFAATKGFKVCPTVGAKWIF